MPPAAWRLIGLAASSAFDFAQTSRFSLESAQIKQLRATHAAAADMLNLVDDLRVQGKNTFNTLTKADLADGKAGLRTALFGNHHTLKGQPYRPQDQLC